jgi:hypothetical protein
MTVFNIGETPAEHVRQGVHSYGQNVAQNYDNYLSKKTLNGS